MFVRAIFSILFQTCLRYKYVSNIEYKIFPAYPQGNPHPKIIKDENQTVRQPVLSLNRNQPLEGKPRRVQQPRLL